MKVKKMTDNDIKRFSAGEVTSFGTISKKECIRAEGGLYDLSIFGTVDFCHCGNPAFPGWVCDQCGVKGIPREEAIKCGAYFSMPAPFISDLSLKELSGILKEQYDIKIPPSIEGLWDYSYGNHIGTFALERLAGIQGLEFISDYINRLFYVVHPYFRPICVVDKDKYMPDDCSLSVSLFLQSCILGERNIEDLRDLNLLYDEVMKSNDGFRPGKDSGLRKLLRYNFVGECVSGVIIPDPDIDVTSIGVPADVLCNIPEEKRDWAFIIRYPVLHSYNLMAFRVIPIYTSDKCIRIHPLAVQPFGGDFDGDTMQVVFINECDSDFYISESAEKIKDGAPLYSFKGEYEGMQCDNQNSLSENFNDFSRHLTMNGLPPFSFQGDNHELENLVPKLRGKTLNSLFLPMYSLSTSLINGLSCEDFISLSVINRDVLSVKQDLVAVSGYNTRQLVLAMWNENPMYATSFTEGMTQKALSLKHGGDSSVKNPPVNREKIVSFSGRVAESPSEWFFLSDKYTVKDGWVVKKEETPIYAAIFPMMRMMGFSLGSLNPVYIKKFQSIELVKNYAQSSGVFRIGRDNQFFIGDEEYHNDSEECFIVRDGSMVNFGQKIMTGVTDISFYCDIFPRDLMKEIFIREISFQSGIKFSSSVLEKIFDVLYNYKINVAIAIANNKDFLFQWYSRSLKAALQRGEFIQDATMKKLFGL